uniref:Ribonuclease H-like domain-containing protein n=1 Tax=Tanacetum cinerariifolium TaxID=118510 RepID=A0A6L2KWW7_TANCI|nr:ribonuclease H-like domain-containing protein [Tanacetum cinerariifolium]
MSSEEAEKESTKSDSDEEAYKLEEEAKAKAAKQEGEVRKAKLIDLLGLEVVYNYYNYKLQYDRYCGKMLNRRAESRITNCYVLTRKGLNTFIVYREDGTYEVIPNFKVSDLHLELGINLDIPLSMQDPLDKLDDFANKKRKHANDIHDYFKATKRLKSSVEYGDHLPSTVLNEPLLGLQGEKKIALCQAISFGKGASKVSREVYSLFLKELYLSLKAIVHDNKTARSMQLDTKLQTIELGSLSTTEYCNKISCIVDLSANIDSLVDEKNIVTYAINGLPDKYKGVAGIIHHRNTPLMFAQAQSMLLLMESRLNHRSSRHPARDSSTSLPHVLLVSLNNQNNDNNAQLCRNFQRCSYSFGERCIRRASLLMDVVSNKLDVKNAFLHRHLTEIVYMHQPPGFVDPAHPNHGTSIAYLLIYVDDIILTASSTELLQQSTYARKVLERAGMLNCNASSTPIATESKLSPDGDPVSGPTLYRNLAGSLQYLTFIRPDILYAVQQSSKRQHVISHSNAEAKYHGVANAVDETSLVRNILRELHMPLRTATLVYCDNVSAVYLSSNPVQHQHTKHIEIDIHFVRDLVATGHGVFYTSVRRLGISIAELRDLEDCGDGDVTLGLLEHLRLDNVEKAVRLCLMMKETEVKIAKKNIYIRRLRRNKLSGVNLLLEAALKYVGVCGFLGMLVVSMMPNVPNRFLLVLKNRLLTVFNEEVGGDVAVIKEYRAIACGLRIGMRKREECMGELKALGDREGVAETVRFMEGLQADDMDRCNRTLSLMREVEVKERKKYSLS